MSSSNICIHRKAQLKLSVLLGMLNTGDPAVTCRYGMLDPSNKDSNDLPLTIRAVFIIGPDKKLKLSLNYPASVGRNMEEIVRCVDALQLSAKHSVVSLLPPVCPLIFNLLFWLLHSTTGSVKSLLLPDHMSCTYFCYFKFISQWGICIGIFVHQGYRLRTLCL